MAALSLSHPPFSSYFQLNLLPPSAHPCTSHGTTRHCSIAGILLPISTSQRFFTSSMPPASPSSGHYDISISTHLPTRPQGGIWSAVLSIATFGIWLAGVGCILSRAVVSTLMGLAASNLGFVPVSAPAYSVVMDHFFLLPCCCSEQIFGGLSGLQDLCSLHPWWDL